jgi:hypothetical protein
MELSDNSCIGAFNFDSNLISFYIGYSLILINPISLFYVTVIKLFKNWAMVPSLIESAKNGKLIVLAE